MEEVLRRRDGSGEHLESDGRVGFRTQDAPQQIVGPERTVDEPQQGRTAVRHGRERHTVAVYREVNQEPGLLLRIDLLRQSHPAGGGGLARVAGFFHDRAAPGLRGHVEP